MRWSRERGLTLEQEAYEFPLSQSEEVVSEKLALPHVQNRPRHETLIKERGVANSGEYTLKEVRDDAQKVVDLRKRDEKDDTERGRILEAFICNLAPELGWFGSNAHVIRASEYDDRCNATDAVLVIETKGEKPICLAIDATTAGSGSTLYKKQTRLKESLDSGELTSIKYFSDFKEPGAAGRVHRLDHVPRVVLGINTEGIGELSKQLELVVTKKPGREGAERNLKDHPIKDEMLRAIIGQIEQQIVYSVIHYLELISQKDPQGLFGYRSEQLGGENNETIVALISLIEQNVVNNPNSAAIAEKINEIAEAIPVLEKLGKIYGLDYPLYTNTKALLNISNELRKNIKKVSPESAIDSGARTIGLTDAEWVKPTHASFSGWLEHQGFYARTSRGAA